MKNRRPPVDESDTASRIRLLSWLLGLLSAVVVAAICGLLLLVNGSIVLIVIRILAESDSAWTHSAGIVQFSLFVLPLCMLICEWMVWDFISGRIFKQEEIDG